MKKDMPLEGLRWSRDSGSALYDTPQTTVLGRAGGGNLSDIHRVILFLRSTFYHLFPQRYNNILKQARKSGESFEKIWWGILKFPQVGEKLQHVIKN